MIIKTLGILCHTPPVPLHSFTLIHSLSLSLAHTHTHTHPLYLLLMPLSFLPPHYFSHLSHTLSVSYSLPRLSSQLQISLYSAHDLTQMQRYGVVGGNYFVPSLERFCYLVLLVRNKLDMLCILVHLCGKWKCVSWSVELVHNIHFLTTLTLRTMVLLVFVFEFVYIQHLYQCARVCFRVSCVYKCCVHDCRCV